MADELNIPTHRWYQPRYNISLPNSDFSKQWIFNSGIQKIDNFINGGSFSPSTLFALAEPGVWFDPSDLTTLFQDPAGTTPVTTPGQTVGLMLDKSRGLALGAELVANGDFSGGTTGWTLTGSASVVDGELVFVGGAVGTASFSVGSQPAGSYRMKITKTVLGAAGAANAIISLRSGATSVGQFALGGSNGPVSYDNLVVATGAFDNVQVSYNGSGAYEYKFDNISVRELPGNHATQATLAARPTYSVEPVGGRRNLLLQTEQFSDSAWTKVSVLSVTADATTAPDGTNTADTVTEASGTAWHSAYNTAPATVISGQNHSASVYVRAGTRRYVQVSSGAVGGSNQTNFGVVVDTSVSPMTIVSTGNGTSGTYASSSIQSVGSGWHRVSITGSIVSTVGYLAVSGIDSASYSSNPQSSGSQTFVIWGAQLERGPTVTNYQRVTTQHDVTEAGVASVGYLYFDGVNDAMATSTITPGIDKAQVFAGVRKLSDAAAGIIVESSGNVDANNGSIILLTNPNTYGTKLRGTTAPSSVNAPTSYAAPITNVVTGLGDISADINTLRINGTQVAQGTADLGTGNFLAYPLYIGARSGGSLPFPGHLYSLITRFGPTLDAPTIASTETWVAGKTGFYTPIITGVPTIGVS